MWTYTTGTNPPNPDIAPPGTFWLYHHTEGRFTWWIACHASPAMLAKVQARRDK